jgi:hypothetical protein
MTRGAIEIAELDILETMSYSLLVGVRAPLVRKLFSKDKTMTALDDEWTQFPPVWAGGNTVCPRIALVFINPTLRNQGAREKWQGDRAPFLGIRRPWKFLASCGLLDNDIVDSLPADQCWTEGDAEMLYNHVAESSLYVTNLVKACRSSADMPSAKFARLFLALLRTELALVQPAVIVPMGNLVSSLLLGRAFKLSVATDHLNRTGKPLVADNFGSSAVIPTYFPVGRGSPTRARAILAAI